MPRFFFIYRAIYDNSIYPPFPVFDGGIARLSVMSTAKIIYRAISVG